MKKNLKNLNQSSKEILMLKSKIMKKKKSAQATTTVRLLKTTKLLQHVESNLATREKFNL